MIDRGRRHPDAGARRATQRRADLLVPVFKAWCTDLGIAVASTGIQVHGGMGYVEETGAAQHLRDACIAPIYEGRTASRRTISSAASSRGTAAKPPPLCSPRCGERSRRSVRRVQPTSPRSPDRCKTGLWRSKRRRRSSSRRRLHRRRPGRCRISSCSALAYSAAGARRRTSRCRESERYEIPSPPSLRGAVLCRALPGARAGFPARHHRREHGARFRSRPALTRFNECARGNMRVRRSVRRRPAAIPRPSLRHRHDARRSCTRAGS